MLPQALPLPPRKLHSPHQHFDHVVLTIVFLDRLKRAAEEAKNLTPEAVFAKMSPEEKKRLSRVRNIGIAVCRYWFP